MNEIKAGIALNYINILVRVSVGFFLSPYILDKLGTNEFGVYTIAGTIVGWLALSDFGLTASATKFLSEYRAKGDDKGEAHYLGNIAALFSIIGIAVLIAGLCIFPFLGDIFPKFTQEGLSICRILYLMTLLNTSFMFPARTLNGIATSRQKFFVPGMVTTITSLLNVIGIIFILMLGYKSIVLTGFSISLGIANLSWNIFYCFRILKVHIAWNGWDKNLCRGMFSFSVWMFLDQLILMINSGSGTFIVGMTRGADDIPVFSYGLHLFQYFAMLSGCVAGVFLPKIVKMVVIGKNNEEQTDLMIKVARLQTALISCMFFGIILFGREFFSLWIGKTLGERSDDSWFITVAIMIPYGIPLVQSVAWQIFQARNAMKYRVCFLTSSSTIFLIIGYYCSLTFGIKALALATACSVVAQSCFSNWYCWKKLGLNIPRFFKETFSRAWLWMPLLIGIGMAANQYIPITGWESFFFKIALFAGLYTFVMFIFYIKPSERNILMQTFKK